MPRRSYAILGGLMFALATPAVAGTPAQWFTIVYDGPPAYGWSCLVVLDRGPRGMMDNLDAQGRRYHMENVEEQGQVMETTMTFVSSGPTPRVEHWTWYRGKERCEKALRARREDAQREQQRREKYR